MLKRYSDRSEAGRVLACHLRVYADRDDLLVLGLPRGGVPVAYEVARSLDAPLDVFLVRKLGVPGHEELAMGAIATGGVRVLNRQVIRELGIVGDVIERVAAAEREELGRRERVYRGGRPAPQVCDRTIITIDDGLATGSTMRAAAAGLRQQHPRLIVVAVPIAPLDICRELRAEVDDVVCPIAAHQFRAVGSYYDNFAQTTDEEVRQILARAADEHPAARPR